MQYEDALKLWGSLKLESIGYTHIQLDTVEVKMEFNEGYVCCGGSDPNCYCSFAESPKADVVVQAIAVDSTGWQSRKATYSQSAADFNFTTVLKEILEVANEEITLEHTLDGL